DRGLSLRQGTIVDATLINAPSSTKNKDGKRDAWVGKRGSTSCRSVCCRMPSCRNCYGTIPIYRRASIPG
ncbi:MAG: hypothetical protein U1A07_20390, partial [Phenylobacterium sp.]|nr:hypothetical protein [Phenylobacterium sp.]